MSDDVLDVPPDASSTEPPPAKMHRKGDATSGGVRAVNVSPTDAKGAASDAEMEADVIKKITILESEMAVLETKMADIEAASMAKSVCFPPSPVPTSDYYKYCLKLTDDQRTKQMEQLAKQMDGLRADRESLTKQLELLTKQADIINIESLTKLMEPFTHRMEQLAKQTDGINRAFTHKMEQLATQMDGLREQVAKEVKELKKGFELSELGFPEPLPKPPAPHSAGRALQVSDLTTFPTVAAAYREDIDADDAPSEAALYYVQADPTLMCFGDDYGDSGRRYLRAVQEKVCAVFQNVMKRSVGCNMLLDGHSGIGKTHFLDVLLMLALKEYPAIAVLTISVWGKVLFLQNNENGERKRYRLLRPTGDLNFEDIGVPRSTLLLVLHDIKRNCPYENDVSCLRKYFKKVVCVIASPPKCGSYDQFISDATPVRVHLTTLSKAEAWAYFQDLEVEDPSVAVRDCFEERFHGVGGVPRHLRNANAYRSALEIQEGFVRGVKYDVTSANTAHMIVACVMPDGEVEIPVGASRVYMFVSRRAERRWLAENRANICSAILEQIRKARDCLRVSNTMIGRIFEMLVLETLLDNNRPPLCRRLVGTVSKPETRSLLEPWNVPKRRVSEVIFKGMKPEGIVAEISRQPQLHVPEVLNFPVVDCVLTWLHDDGNKKTVRATLVQVTVDKDHKPKKEATARLLHHLKVSNIDVQDMVWVVNAKSQLNGPQAFKDPQVVFEDPATVNELTAAAATYDQLPQYIAIIDDPSLLCWVAKAGQTDVYSFPMFDEGTRLQKIQIHVDPTAAQLATGGEYLGTPTGPVKYLSTAPKN